MSTSAFPFTEIPTPQFYTKPLENIREHKFSPYEDNGGSTLAISGKDFCVIAADTRLSEGYAIATRYSNTKIIKLTDKCVLATSGMQADAQALHKNIVARLIQYEHQNGKQMSTTAIAQMLAIMLYGKRFFPYYTFNVLGGIDDEGLGCSFSYDAVGSYERVRYTSSGSGQKLLQPLLDNQVGRHNQLKVPSEELTVKETEDLVQDAFNSAGERDIHTGDFVNMYTVTSAGVQHRRFNIVTIV